MFRIVSSAAWPRLMLCAFVVAAAAIPVAAQTPTNLRVTHNVDKTGPTSAELSGRVFNDGAVDVIDVYVNAAAIDASGKVLAQGIPFVGSVPARGSTPFKARVPVVAGASSDRGWIKKFYFPVPRNASPRVPRGGVIRPSGALVGSPPP